MAPTLIRLWPDANLALLSFLMAGFRRAGDRIRVTVQLLNVRDGTAVWAGQFDEKFTDVLESGRRDLFATSRKRFVPHLTGDERLRLAKRGTNDPQAHEAYLRGRFYWNTFTEDGFARAIVCYHQAIALDPNYARCLRRRRGLLQLAGQLHACCRLPSVRRLPTKRRRRRSRSIQPSPKATRRWARQYSVAILPGPVPNASCSTRLSSIRIIRPRASSTPCSWRWKAALPSRFMRRNSRAIWIRWQSSRASQSSGVRITRDALTKPAIAVSETSGSGAAKSDDALWLEFPVEPHGPAR